jgi:hypothetical protein
LSEQFKVKYQIILILYYLHEARHVWKNNSNRRKNCIRLYKDYTWVQPSILFLFVFVPWLVLLVNLDCPFSIAPSLFSNGYLQDQKNVHLNMEYLCLSWYDILEIVAPNKNSLIEDTGLLLTRKPLNQWFLCVVKLKLSLRKFNDRHHYLVNRYGFFVLQRTMDMFRLS